MKQYNAKILVDNDKFRIAYECDKENNKECPGYLNFRECNHTINPKYAVGIDYTEEKIKKMITTNYYSLNGELIKTVTEIKYEN